MKYDEKQYQIATGLIHRTNPHRFCDWTAHRKRAPSKIQPNGFDVHKSKEIIQYFCHF